MDKRTIREMIKIIKNAQKLCLETIKCDSMTEEQFFYFKEGLKRGYDEAIFALKEEL